MECDARWSRGGQVHWKGRRCEARLPAPLPLDLRLAGVVPPRLAGGGAVARLSVWAPATPARPVSVPAFRRQTRARPMCTPCQVRCDDSVEPEQLRLRRGEPDVSRRDRRRERCAAVRPAARPRDAEISVALEREERERMRAELQAFVGALEHNL